MHYTFLTSLQWRCLYLFESKKKKFSWKFEIQMFEISNNDFISSTTMKFYFIALIVIASFTIVTITIVCNVVMTIAINDDDELFSKSFCQCYVFFISYLSEILNFTIAQNIFIREMCRFTKNEMFQILSHFDLQNIRFRVRYATNSKIALTILCVRFSYFDRLKSLMHNFDHSKT